MNARKFKFGETVIFPYPLSVFASINIVETLDVRLQATKPLEQRAMPSRNVTPKQPKASVLRAKRKREPQVHENAKTAIIIKGRKTSQNVTDALKDLVSGTASHTPQQLVPIGLAFVTDTLYCCIWL